VFGEMARSNAMLSGPPTVSGATMWRCILRRASVLCAGGTSHRTGGEQMSDTYDLFPVAWGLAVPRRVCDALVDMGTACNDAALTLDRSVVPPGEADQPPGPFERPTPAPGERDARMQRYVGMGCESEGAVVIPRR